MRAANVVIVILGIAGLSVAVVIAVRGRRAPLLAPRELPATRGASTLDALRTLAAVMGAGLVSGILVPGLGGRLFMRLIAATSGDAAAGRLTEAEEVVGDITLDGSLGFVVFVGILIPMAATLSFLALRHFLPGPAALGGTMFGVILLGAVGVAGPMSPDSVDFEIASPLWLAVAGIVLLGLLFGATFAALASRFDATLRPLGAGGAAIPRHLPLVAAVVPPFVFVAVPYVVLRTVLHGRAQRILEQSPVRVAGTTLVGIGTVVAGVATVAAAAEIL